MLDSELLPTYLTCVVDDMNDIEQILESYKMNIPAPSFIYNGIKDGEMFLRELKQIATDKNVFLRHINAENGFTNQIVACMQEYINIIGMSEEWGTFYEKSLDAIKSISISCGLDDKYLQSFPQERELYIGSNLTHSLTYVFVAIGELAYKARTPVCMLVDGMRDISANERKAFFSALRRPCQLGFPIICIIEDLEELNEE